LCWGRARKFTQRCRYELIEPLKPIVYYIDPAPEKENISGKVLIGRSLLRVRALPWVSIKKWSQWASDVCFFCIKWFRCWN
jgi:hypothetical protein